MNLRIMALAVLFTGAALADGPRETVLDRKIHTEEGIAELPTVPPLCDTLKTEKRRIRAGDCSLFCETEGNGPALVLINGGPGGTHHGFHPHFGRAAGFATVVYYDQRGCGQSDYAKGAGYTVDQAVDDLDQVREALKLERWVVLGWSYGGVLAQAYTIKYPERMAGLVLVGSSTDALHLSLGPDRQHEFISPAEQKKIDEVYSQPGLSLAQAVFNAHLNGDWKRQSFYRPTREELAREALYGWKHDPFFRGSISRDLRRIDLRGLFQGCPIRVLILEGRHDLTEGVGKPAKLAACFPGSRLVMFERAAHAPFADEPEKFFATLREFIKALPEKTTGIEEWKEQIAARQAQKRSSPEYFLASSGWGRKSAAKIAARYEADWLNELTDETAFLKLGFALYEARRYEDALAVFQRMEQASGQAGVALVWQGHMLDLLGRREEAIAAYKKASALSFGMQHGQFRLAVNAEYAKQRLQTPFSRVENMYEE
jgi:proline iminopeptidase